MPLVLVLNALIAAKRRSLSQLFPESLAKHWNLWELRALILLTLSFQSVLIFCGNRRRYKHQIWIRFVVWLSYQAADWLSSFSLSLLSHGQDDCKKISLDPNYVIMAFWAPIFLLQLCTPDTITAYSLEDNELWIRQFLGISGQFVASIYILNRSWTSSPTNYLAIPMLVAAFIKFGEKIYVQYMASSDQFRDSMLTSPDPGPNYAKFMDAYSAKKAEGFEIRRGPLIEIPLEAEEVEEPPLSTATSFEEREISDEEILKQGYEFFESFRLLFADLILSFQDYRTSRSFFRKHSSKVAFKVIEVELGFVYDVLYTKAIVISSPLAFFRRLVSLLLLVCVACVFIFFYRNDFSKMDVEITCFLLAGAIFLEIYQVVLFLNSDWASLRLGRQHCLVTFLQSLHLVPANKRWSDHVAQYNLLSFCINENSTTRNKVHKWFHEKSEKYRYTNQSVSSELKELVFQQLLEKSTTARDMKGCRELCGCRGERALEMMGFGDELGWTVEVEFDQSILLWHIATDLLYFHDLNKNPSLVENSKCRISKVMSDYMVYLLVMQPSMLPNGIGLIRFRDSCAEAIEFLQEWKYIKDVNQACSELFLVNSTEVLPCDVKGDRSKSVLFDACRLAKSLQSFVKERQLNDERKWDLLSHLWVEIMCYAACHCKAQNHSKQLPMGGELLTHVWLLMAHLGISEQFQIAQGHGRVKMLVS